MQNKIKYKTFNKKNLCIKIKSFSNMYLFVSKGEVIVYQKNKKIIIKKMTISTLYKNKNYRIDSINGIFNIYYLNANLKYFNG